MTRYTVSPPMLKIKEILIDHLEAKDHGGFDIRIEGIDTAASAIEKVHDEEMVGFLKWFCLTYDIRSDYSEHSLIDTINKDLQLYKNK